MPINMPPDNFDMSYEQPLHFTAAPLSPTMTPVSPSFTLVSPIFTPASPAFGSSIDSDASIVSRAVPPFLQPSGPVASSSRPRPILTPPITAEQAHFPVPKSPLNPHSGDLLGHPTEMRRRRLSVALAESQPAAGEHGSESGPPVERNDLRHVERSPPAQRRRLNLHSLINHQHPENEPDQVNVTAFHYPTAEQPNFDRFDAVNPDVTGMAFNGLGMMPDSLHSTTTIRPRLPFSTNHFARYTAGGSSISSSDSARPLAPRDQGMSTLLWAYGMTGEAMQSQPSSAVSLQSTASTAHSLTSTVPPPRPARHQTFDDDAYNFSPSHSREPTNVPPRMPPHSQSHRDRLQTLDAMRTGRPVDRPRSPNRVSPWLIQPLSTYGANPPLVATPPQQPPSSPPYWPYRTTAEPPFSAYRSQANDIASRQSRYPADERRDLRSRVPSSEIDFQDNDGAADIGRWNRNVNDAISRRVAGSTEDVFDRFAYPTPHREPFVFQDRASAAVIDGNAPPRLWGNVPAAAQARPVPSLSFGWVDSGSMTDPLARGDAYSAYLAARAALGEGYDWDREDPDSDNDDVEFLPPRTMMEDNFPGPDVMHTRLFTSDNELEMVETLPRTYSRLPQPLLEPLARLRKIDTPINKDTSPEMRTTIINFVTKQVARLPRRTRRHCALQSLKQTEWANIEPGFDRDACCTVCHDEYQDDTPVSITPCKHMYHKDCLETWLATPGTTSCPMCRRDLAMAVCLAQMTGSKEEDAVQAWMSVGH